jgi:hypothetical protein
MTNCLALENPTSGRKLLAALGVAVAVGLPQAAHAADVRPPPVPGNIAVPAGNEPFLVGHAVGTQNYVCVPSGAGVAFSLFTPQAILFGDNGQEIITHFFSPNPFEDNTNPAVTATGTIRAAWQWSEDASTVWAQAKPGNASTDSAFVAPNSVAWLLLTVRGAENGPTGGDFLAETTFIQRLKTSGGVAPSMGCTSATDLGNLAFVPYTADYFFFKKDH